MMKAPFNRNAWRSAMVLSMFLIAGWFYANTVSSFDTDISNWNLPSIQKSEPKTSKLHFLIPSSLVKPPLCAVVASALANRYPVPTIVGYKGQGEFDAKKAHIAKLRAIKRYLDNTPGAKPDDLVVVVDGFDVLAQIPVNAMIERYFNMAEQADHRLADKRGISVEELHASGVRQSIMFGADKGCFPHGSKGGDRRDPRCWLIPTSELSPFAWGSNTDSGDLVHSEPRFLNSGTIMGPLGDIQQLINAALQLIKETWDKDYKFRNSDQFYLATLYGRQEYHRILDYNGGVWPGEVGEKDDLPPKRAGANDTTEHHIFLDFDSSFTQTQCHNDKFMQKLKYDSFDRTATANIDHYEEGDKHRAFKVQMPSFIYKAFGRIYDSLPVQNRKKTTDEWVKGLELGTNIATRQIYAFYHNTCSKRAFVEKYQKMWLFPIIRPLLYKAALATQEEEPLHPGLLDGRHWKASQRYPMNDNGELQDKYGGVFTDAEGETFIPFQELCSEDLKAIID